MVDNAWRDSFRIKALPLRHERLPDERDPRDLIAEEDNSTLLEIEKKANLSKKSGGDGLFAGTYFEAPTTDVSGAAVMMKKAPIKFDIDDEEEEKDNSPTVFQQAAPAESKGRRGKSIYNRATQVLDAFAERLSSGGESIARRKNSKDRENKDDDVESHVTYENSNGRRTTVGPRVKSVVSKLTRATSRRKKNSNDGQFLDAEEEVAYSSVNPNFGKEHMAEQIAE